MAKEKAAAKNKAEDLKGKSADELNAMLLTLRKDQINMRFKKAGGALENPSEIRKNRRIIARVKTFLGQGIKKQDGAAPKAATKTKAAPKAAAKKKA